MSETIEEEKERLLKRLDQLNVNSAGRDRIIQRLVMIHTILLDEREGTVQRSNEHHQLLRGRDYETSVRGV